MKKFYTIVCSALLVCLFCIPLSAHAATYTVTKTADTADGTCDSDCSLREAIIAANENSGSDTINIPAAVDHYILERTGAGENLASTGDFDITDTAGILTITGAGSDDTIIDGNNGDRIFETRTNATLVLESVTITNGNITEDNGGALLNTGTTTVENSTIQESMIVGNISTPYYGAGVHCTEGNLTITDSVIRGNTFFDSTDLLFGGGVAIDDDCNATLTRTTLTENNAQTGGGATLYTGTDNTITLTDVTVSENTAVEVGGGIAVIGDTGDTPASFDRLAILDNSAYSGGGVYSTGPLFITNATFYENIAEFVGGGIYTSSVDNPLIRIAFSTLTHNEAEYGGGITAGGVEPYVRLKGNIFANNEGVDCDSHVISEDYNYIEDITYCPEINVEPHDQFNEASPSYLFTAMPGDNGGHVYTTRMWGEEILDLVPAEDCTDASGDELSVDGRGIDRPQGSGCDLGAYEKDQTAPVVTPTVGTDTIECHLDEWSDAGASATDNFSSNITIDSIEGTVDTTTVGEYDITYTTSADDDYNTGTAVRTVTVEDTLRPTLTLRGDQAVTLEQGDTYSDAGATAQDSCEGNLNTAIETENGLESTVPGTYTITYSVEDASGNTKTATRTVTVIARRVSNIERDFGTLTIQYGNGSRETITPFGGRNNFRYVLDSNERRIVVTNGRLVRVFVNGNLIAQQRIGERPVQKKNYRIEMDRLYAGYHTIAIVKSHDTTAVLHVMRLKRTSDINHLVSKRVAIPGGSEIELMIIPATKKIVMSYTQSGDENSVAWRLSQRGKLRRVD